MPTKTVLLLFIIFFQPGILFSQDVTGKWSGTMTVELWWEGITGPSHKKFEMTIQDNVVTGTMTGEGKFIIDGKQLGEHKCSGTGTGELWRLAFNADGTYDLEITSPPFTCTGYNLLENEGKPGISHGNTEGLDAHSQPIPRDRSILTGRIDTSGENPGLGKFRRYVSWFLTTKPLDVKLIVSPVKYDTWLPVPGLDEESFGSTMIVNLKIQNRDGTVPIIKVGSFELTLMNTSDEPGITLNMPKLNAGTKPDIKFIGGGDISQEGQFIFLYSGDGYTGSVTLGAFDGGGWTTLNAAAILENGMRIRGTLMNPNGPTDILIPKRKAGSHIADYWLQLNGNPGEMDDEEKINPQNPNKGDGFTAYEEYRGFISRNQFKRFDPKKNELTVRLLNSQETLFTPGMERLKRAAGIDVVPFYIFEVPENRNINFNSNTSHDGDQYALKLVLGRLPDGESGHAYGAPNTPENVNPIVIDTMHVRSGYEFVQDLASIQHISLSCSYTEHLATVVAHELAHGISSRHHGVSGPDAPDSVAHKDDPIRIIEYKNRDITYRPYTIGKSVGNPGNQQSGNVNCIMAYNNFRSWVYKRVGLFNCYYEVPAYCSGTILCIDGVGTGLNINREFFENSPRGKCLYTLKFK